MNLFGLKIIRNHKYVLREDCFRVQDTFKEELRKVDQDIKDYIKDRLEDYKDFFLKNGSK